MRETPRQQETIPDPPQGPYESWSEETRAEWTIIFNNFFLKLRTTPPPWDTYANDKETLRESYQRWGEKKDPTEEGHSEKRASETDGQFRESIYKAVTDEGINMEIIKEMHRFRVKRTIANVNVLLVPAVRRLLAEGYTLLDLCI